MKHLQSGNSTIKMKTMKKVFSILSVFTIAAFIVTSCSDIKREPGSVYMPDMATSRAYETYADYQNLKDSGIHYTTRPVEGTMNRGEELPYHLTNDSLGYAQSASMVSPLQPMTKLESTEAERLYLINCGICHGTALDGNGPLYKDGTGPYAAKPATLVGDATIEALSAGTIFHVQTYGKNLMGSYASQLSRKQRWQIAEYIKNKQKKGAATETAAASDSTAVSTTK